MTNKREKQKGQQPSYVGIGPEFRAACLKLCCGPFPVSTWHKWRSLSVQKPDGTVTTFPNRGNSEEILTALDYYLFSLLGPKDMAPPNRNMKPRWRADLNKYRGWLLNRVIRQVLETDQDFYARRLNTQRRYLLPEDLPKVVDDLYLFHKHVKGKEANIARYSLDDLNLLVEPHRPKYPISHKERSEAHARFLQTRSPRELEELLPPGWKAFEDHVLDAAGRKIERDETGAKLIAILEDGTEVIQLLTEKASLAYGSPRWCTAYRERETYFEHYKDNLLAVLAPDGQRWQIHIASGQWMDAADQNVDQKGLLRARPGLAKALLPVLVAIRQGPREARRNESYSDALTTIVHCVSPEIDNNSPQDLADVLNSLSKLVHPQSDYAFENIIEASNKKPAWRKEIGANMAPLLFTAAEHGGGRAFSILLSSAESVQEWRTGAAKHLGAVLCDHASREGSSAIVGAVLKWAGYVPEWHKAVEQNIAQAFLTSLKTKGNGSLLEIIRSANEEPLWRKAIKRHIGAAVLSLTRNRDGKLWDFLWAAHHQPELKAELAVFSITAKNYAKQYGYPEAINFIDRVLQAESDLEQKNQHRASRQYGKSFHL